MKLPTKKKHENERRERGKTKKKIEHETVLA